MTRTTALLFIALTLAACGGGPDSGKMSAAEVAHVQSGGAVEVDPGAAPPSTTAEPAGTPWPGEPSVTILAWAESVVPAPAPQPAARPAPVVLTDGQGRSATVEVALTPPPPGPESVARAPQSAPPPSAAPRTTIAAAPQSAPQSALRPEPKSAPRPEPGFEPQASVSSPAPRPPAPAAATPTTPRVQPRGAIREEPLPPTGAPRAQAPASAAQPAPRPPQSKISPAPAPKSEAPEAPVVRRISFAGQGGSALSPEAGKVAEEIGQMYGAGGIGRLTVAGYGPAAPAGAPTPEGQEAPPDLRLPLERAFAVARALEEAGVPLAAVTVSAHTGPPGSDPHVLLTAIPAPRGQ